MSVEKISVLFIFPPERKVVENKDIIMILMPLSNLKNPKNGDYFKNLIVIG